MSTLSYEPVTGRKTSKGIIGRILGWTIGLGLLLLLLFGFLAPSLCRSSETANRVKCGSNERQIGQAILIFANEHAGKYPDTLEDLFLSGADITSELFCCPSSNDEKALGDTPAQIVAELSKPSHLSYVYLGKGLTTSSPPETPVLYEPVANHDNDGGNVLYADGHVAWCTPKELAQLPGVKLTTP